MLKNTQAAEALVKLYETKLCEEEAVIADKNNIENLISTLKVYVSLLAVLGCALTVFLRHQALNV